MPENECDQDCEYKRQRIAAAQEVEVWIQRDARVLDIFRERIRFASEQWEEFDRECTAVSNEQERLWGADWKAAMRDPKRRDKSASAPGPEYEWHQHTSHDVVNRLTKEDFEDLIAEGFNGTWEEVQKAWCQKRWGYWRRKAPVVKRTGLPWLAAEWVNGQHRIDPPPTSGGALQLHYAVLTAIHDGDLQGVALISQVIWPEPLQKAAYLEFWVYRGNKSDLIQTALRVVRQDLDATLKELAGERKPPGGGDMPTGEWSRPMSKARMMRALGIDSYKTFRAWLMDKEIKQLGNRKTWIIRLDTLDARTRERLERA